MDDASTPALFGDERLPRRFWDKARETETCWLWTASLNRGYGQIYDRDFGRAIGAHRFAYVALVGPIPTGLVLDHLCRVPTCVNPAHLEPVTHRVNLLRGEGPSAQHARKTHCPAGHEYDRVNIEGARGCSICSRVPPKQYARLAPSQPRPGYESVRGPRSRFWTGNDVTYAGVHQRLKKQRGLAREYACTGCDRTATEWAYDHADPDERRDEGKQLLYSASLDHYQPMCRPCHRLFDRSHHG